MLDVFFVSLVSDDVWLEFEEVLSVDELIFLSDVVEELVLSFLTFPRSVVVDSLLFVDDVSSASS